MKVKLKPCPFCGSRVQYMFSSGGEYRIFIQCKNPDCNVLLTVDNENARTEEIEEKWNRRTAVLDGISVKTGMSKEELKEDLMEALKEGEE